MKLVRVLAALVLSPLAVASADAQTQTASTPPGIRVKAGDTVFIDGPDKVKIVRRQHADIRTVHNPAERWLAVIVDYKTDGKSGDTQADINYTFQGIADWPLGERWSGSAVIDEYFFAGQGISAGIGLSTSGGFVQVLNSVADVAAFSDSAALTLFSKGFGRGGGGGGISMDTAEQQTIAQAQRNAERARSNQAAGGVSMQSHMEFGVVGGVGGGIVATPSSSSGTLGVAPMRVGGNIRAPQKIYTVEAVRPKTAMDAGIF